MKTYHVHNDPGHGWIAVKLKELVDLGVAKKITPFSYLSRSGKTVYLEEDCDAEFFIQAWQKKTGLKFRDHYKSSHTNKQHWIRSLERFDRTKYAGEPYV